MQVVQRHRGQPERGDPALGLAVQVGQVVLQFGRCGTGLAAGLAQREEALGFGQRKAQVLGVYLEQLTGCAQPAQPQVGQAARAQHQLAAARQVIDDFAQQTQHGGIGDQFEVVQEQREWRAVPPQRVHQHQRRGTWRQVDNELRQRLAQAGQEARHVVVGPVQRQPGGVHAALCHALARLDHRGGLAEAGGRAHQHQLDRAGGHDPLADGIARHLGRGDAGRTELGRQGSRCGRPG